MKGDFARVTFDPTLHYSQVLHQQGRVLLEADWNEQGAIQLYLLRTLISDLVGACWAAGEGFMITKSGAGLEDWTLSPGHFYVDGLLCVNGRACTLEEQPYRQTPDDGWDGTSAFDDVSGPCWLWLDAWERHLSCVEAPSINDSALGGIDTASRAQVVWQVRSLQQDAVDALIQEARGVSGPRDDASDAEIDAYLGNPSNDCEYVRRVLGLRARFACPRLRASLGQVEAEADACIIAPDARYRGCENQLYRVEIHRGGKPGDGNDGGATFKWSRENGSTIFPVVAAPTVVESANAEENGKHYKIKLANLGRDARLGLAVGDWVELLDDDLTLAQRALPLLRVVDIGSAERSVTVLAPASSYTITVQMDRHPLLRRWDQRKDANVEGTCDVQEDTDFELEDGVHVAFEPGGLYANGDYWLIPARVAGNGMLDWPHEQDGGPAAVDARGLHHVAVLGSVDANGGYTECCCRWPTLCSLLEKGRKGDDRATRPNVAPDAASTTKRVVPLEKLIEVRTAKPGPASKVPKRARTATRTSRKPK
jgi:Family of unknown function (DUF6519)